MKTIAIALLLLAASLARADAPLLLTLEIDETSGSAHQVARHSISVATTGEQGQLEVDGPGATITTLKLRVLGNPSGYMVDYEIARRAADHSSWVVHSQAALPPPGQKVAVARLERAAGPVEIRLQSGALTATR